MTCRRDHFSQSACPLSHPSLLKPYHLFSALHQSNSWLYVSRCPRWEIPGCECRRSFLGPHKRRKSTPQDRKAPGASSEGPGRAGGHSAESGDHSVVQGHGCCTLCSGGAFKGTKELQPCPDCSKSLPRLVHPRPLPPQCTSPDCTTT